MAVLVHCRGHEVETTQSIDSAKSWSICVYHGAWSSALSRNIILWKKNSNVIRLDRWFAVRIENRMNNKFGFRFFVSLSILLSGLAGSIGCVVCFLITQQITRYFIARPFHVSSGKVGSGMNNYITRINKLFSKPEFIWVKWK